MSSESSLFAEEFCLRRISELGDPLERVSSVVDFEMFRPMLDEGLGRGDGSKGGRPAYDCVMMFKIQLLQLWNGLSDDAAERQITDRFSFRRFLGLTWEDRVPDAKTIWKFRETLTAAGVIDRVFDAFDRRLDELGIVNRKGSIVDSTFTDAPGRRNRKGEDESIKNGETPAAWKDDSPARIRQKDVDARWTKKDDEVHYGYKSHVKVDAKSKIVIAEVTGPANEHDVTRFDELLDERDEIVYADSGYVGADRHAAIRDRLPNVSLDVCERANRNRPLKRDQTRQNKRRAGIRSRVEHVFGHMVTSMHGKRVRSIGLERAKATNKLRCLAYNVQRFEAIMRLGLA
jgi:IS5 family transposase